MITLTNPITVSCAVTLDASGHSVTISGGNSNQLFIVQSNASLSLIRLTIANGLRRGTNGGDAGTNGNPFGYPTAGSTSGGAIYANSSSLILSNCAFTGNYALGGKGGSRGQPSQTGPSGIALGAAVFANEANCS